MIIAKFGGGLLNGADGLRRVRDEIKSLPRPLVVVASAFGHVTNQLEAIATTATISESEALELLATLADEHRVIAREVLDDASFERWLSMTDEYIARLEEIVRGLAIVHELSPRTMDLAVSYGEHLSSATLLAVLCAAGVSAIGIPATELIITDNRHRFARPNIELTRTHVLQRLRPALVGDAVVVTEGYIARSASGETTTMGRESSDYSATLLGELLGAGEVRIYTAVPGILTADPTVVASARTLSHLGYGAARTLGELGAKILHARTVFPVEQAGIPLIIRSLDDSGTTIDNRADESNGCSIALLRSASMVTVNLAAVSTGEDAFVRDLSSHAPLVWRSRFRRRLQLVTAARTDRSSLALRHLEGTVDAHVTDGAVVSLVRQRGVDAADMSRFFGAMSAAPLAVLGGIERHAVGVFVDESVDCVELVRALHERFVDK